VAGARDRYGGRDWSWFLETQVTYPLTASGEYASSSRENHNS
jgi:hypothetical protein